MRNAPKLPTGKMIKCEGVVLTSSGRVKKIKVRDSEMKKWGKANPKKKPPKKRKAKTASHRKATRKRR